MSRIKVMDEDLANKIAAGEVVEKLMNIVKELVENSIDAESDEIKIELLDSGMKMIKVSDNGIGMDKDDAILAFSRHATSKCKDLNDLFNITSLGFRGEALPSIASISKVTLKTANDKVGTKIKIAGGTLIEQKKSDLQKGTDITVTDIFYNTPVRLKYIKNLYTELSNIISYLNKMALSYPNIKFTLINNEKVLMKTDGSGNLQKVIYEIYGSDVSKKMVEISGENDDYYISGYISYPEMSRSTRNNITIMVNGRVIRNNDIIREIKDAYHTYIPKDKYPVVVLNIDVDPILVDVNIHPTKMDVKFSKMDTLRELIKETINDKLKTLLLIPDASVRTSFAIEEVTQNNKIEEHVEEIEEKVEINEINLNKVEEIEEEEYTPPKTEEIRFVEDTSTSPYKIKKMIPKGIVYKTYIIAENEDGVFIIDQHAAAERVNYEKCLALLTKDHVERIPLLIPISLEFPTNEYIIIKNNLDILENIGFEIEDFGINTFVIRSHPIFIIKEGQEESDIRKIFQIIAENEKFDKKKFIHYTAATMACRMSIKANDYITLEEAEYVLDNLRKCDNPFNCPHGRPTIITYTKYELEKMFKRVMN